ncbi:PSD1 and planctomycete cytochrome C domain-containing protein [bacterium]|nr:PSD1 and planctomycete cytochrome C domain-containing protein [bacterium]
MSLLLKSTVRFSSARKWLSHGLIILIHGFVCCEFSLFWKVVAADEPGTITLTDDPISYGRSIRPILSRHCFKCHGPDEEARESGLRLDQQEASREDLGGYAAVIPGELEESELLVRVLSDDPDLRMPPPEAGDTLGDDEVTLLANWVKQGGQYEQHWAFEKPVLQVVPTVADPIWCRGELDRFVLHQMELHGLRPSPEVDRRRLIRRLFLDLSGITPSPEEVERFVADDHPAAVRKLVDRLLASPGYGERFARPWLDLARYSDTNGYEKDRPRSIWPYRDWVIDAMNQDMPFDQFSIEQLAGDMLPEATQDQRVATGFHRNTMLNEEGGIDPLEYRFYAVVDRVATTGTVWMGLTVGCAQCHTHKFDPITHDEYYGLLALLNQSDEPDLILEDPRLQASRVETQSQIDLLIARLVSDHLPSFSEWNSPRKEPLEVDAAFTDWVKLQLNQARDWNVLQLDRYESTMPKLSVLADGSILASGDVTKRDRYRMWFQVDPSMVGGRSLRLEVLPDSSLPASGPGMAFYEGRRGDFFLSEMIVRFNGEPVDLIDATHSYGKISVGSGNANASNLFDGEGSTGWSTSGQEGKENQLVVNFSQPLLEVGNLEIELLFERHFAAALGRFRLSIANEGDAVASRLPVSWNDELLSVDAGSLMPEMYEKLARQFVMETPLLVKQRKAIGKLQSRISESRRSLGMSQRAKSDYRKTYRHHRGEYLQPRNRVEPGLPAIFGVPASGLVNDRLKLAQWLVSRENPLSARVTVNRVWRELFGTGLLNTAGDFGTQSQQPTHPELLDHLSVRYSQEGWSTKRLHRQLVSSAAYRQVMGESPSSDPENRWLSKFPQRRLQAEQLRDAMISAAGMLSCEIGGKSVYPPQPASVMQLAYGNPGWAASVGGDRFRRSLYTFSKRTAPFAAFSTFDGPSGEVCLARRDRSTTPLQALTLLNDPMFVEIAEALSKQAKLDVGSGSSEMLARAMFVRLLVREPSRDELNAMGRFVDAAPEGEDRWMLLARALMNLDEAVTIP